MISFTDIIPYIQSAVYNIFFIKPIFFFSFALFKLTFYVYFDILYTERVV